MVLPVSSVLVSICRRLGVPTYDYNKCPVGLFLLLSSFDYVHTYKEHCNECAMHNEHSDKLFKVNVDVCQLKLILIGYACQQAGVSCNSPSLITSVLSSFWII